ncbi:MAG: hypothetical protein JNL98_07745 [Bryobacterales bacterium]|nr:hypothetical protein [Bryobacterales bacterium]
MPEKSDSDLIQAATEPLVLSIDLLGYELTHAEDRISLALSEPSVYRRVQELIDVEAGRSIMPRFENFGATGEPAKRIAMGTLSAAGDAVLTSVKQSPRYLKFDESLGNLKSTFGQTPMGVWINSNKTELLIAGSLLTIGGAVAQYHFKTNDTVGDYFAKGVSLATRSIKLGQLDLGADFPKFAPSKRQVDFNTHAGYNFKLVDTRVELGGKVENGKLNQLDGKAMVMVPLKCSNVDVKVTGSVGGSMQRASDSSFNSKLRYSLGVDVGAPKQGVSAGLMLSGENRNYTLGVAAKVHF